MFLKKWIPLLIFAFLILVVTIALRADSTGSIKGTVTDAKTGEGVFGVSVQIEGFQVGSKTCADGNYLILSVREGTYNLVFSAVGYEKTRVESVSVIADKTTECSVQLTATILETEKLSIVTACGKDIDIRQTEIARRKKDTIKRKPVATVDDLLAIEGANVACGAKVFHFRGGRAGEVQYNCAPDATGYYPPAHGGTNIVNDEAFDAMFFKNYGVNPFVDTEDDHLSTFASDVDDASYIMTRSYLNRGALPPNEAVRVEEFVNHFDYNYGAPYREPFSVHLEGSPAPFGDNCSLLRIGIKGMEIPDHLRKPANLVFVIDVSGSMGREDRLGLVKRSLMYLLDELNADDRVGIVVYGSNGQELLQPISIRYRRDIERVIDGLHTNGATNAEEGIRLGYQMADRNFERGKINRIILCSDGVANVGNSGPDAILRDINKYAERGITLSTIGFGMGNYNDILMEKLGNKGNGQYAYVDDIAEARRVFVDNLTGNLQVIARDVKIQVDFNPEVVRSYRLLGYENRDVADNKFRDDKEDGGEVGAGHSVTALYEVKFNEHYAQTSIGTIYVRYKDPETYKVTEFSDGITWSDFNRRFENCTPEFRLAAAAAEFSEILRKSYWARGSKLTDVYRIAKSVDGELRSEETRELLDLIHKAEKFQEDLAEK